MTAPAPRSDARLVSLGPGCYLFSLAPPPRQPRPGARLPAVHVCAPPQPGSVDIVDDFGDAASWLDAHRPMLFVRIAAGGGSALVTAYWAPGAAERAPGVVVRPLAAGAPAMTLSLGDVAAALRADGIDAIAHIRGRGDVRFADAAWIGRLGPGLWLEAVAIQPRDPEAAGSIECKGLIANGSETPWTGGGAPCGTRGQGLPLIGFAVRQNPAAGGTRFDCEYTGYFASGATIGPVRNGAPCRSPTDSDPLEGLQLRIAARLGASMPRE
jgi:hypothetical protein